MAGRRPNEKSFTAALRKTLLAEGIDEDGVPLRLRKLGEVIHTNAKRGEQWALNMIFDRIEGKVPQGIIGGGEDDPAIQVVQTVRRVIVKDETS